MQTYYKDRLAICSWYRCALDSKLANSKLFTVIISSCFLMLSTFVISNICRVAKHRLRLRLDNLSPTVTDTSGLFRLPDTSFLSFTIQGQILTNISCSCTTRYKVASAEREAGSRLLFVTGANSVYRVIAPFP